MRTRTHARTHVNSGGELWRAAERDERGGERGVRAVAGGGRGGRGDVARHAAGPLQRQLAAAARGARCPLDAARACRRAPAARRRRRPRRPARPALARPPSPRPPPPPLLCSTRRRAVRHAASHGAARALAAARRPHQTGARRRRCDAYCAGRTARPHGCAAIASHRRRRPPRRAPPLARLALHRHPLDVCRRRACAAHHPATSVRPVYTTHHSALTTLSATPQRRPLPAARMSSSVDHLHPLHCQQQQLYNSKLCHIQYVATVFIGIFSHKSISVVTNTHTHSRCSHQLPLLMLLNRLLLF
jgi:hypothetical protein